MQGSVPSTCCGEERQLERERGSRSRSRSRSSDGRGRGRGGEGDGSRSVCVDCLTSPQVSICVNAKFWDEGAAKELQNSKFSCRTRIPLDELNMMEIAFLKGLDWNLYLKEEEYERWASILSSKAELSFSEEERAMDSARRNNSPLCSTDLAESIAEILGDCNMVKEELLSVPKKPTAYFIQSNGSSNLYTYAL
eukprot:751858-Hanusia_phi.AAC.2